MTLDELRVRRKAIATIARRYGAHDLRVSGSVVRGEVDAHSDVDFLVELEPGRSVLDLGGLLMDLQEYLHCKGRVAFEREELIQVWIVHHLARLGEAVARLSPEVRRRRAPWKQIIGMRNILIHEYFRIDPETVWTVVEVHLPPLERRVRAISAEIEGR